MCNCASCEYTDSFNGYGLEAAKGGFANWPRGEPKGAVTSAKEYRDHAKHCGSAGLPKPWRFVPRKPPQFSTYGLVMPLPQAPKFVHDWINARGPIWKSTGPVLPGPDARPAKPAKAPRHFPAQDRQRETATIYAMPKSKPVKRSRGRPAIPGRFVVVKLEERLIEKAEKLGGKVAAGIREALERVKVG